MTSTKRFDSIRKTLNILLRAATSGGLPKAISVGLWLITTRGKDSARSERPSSLY